jgi:hypothetical protein
MMLKKGGLFMKKNIYSVSEVSSYRTPFTFSSEKDFSPSPEPEENKYRYPPLVPDSLHICEESSFYVKLKKGDFERYQKSFLKKKIIHIWKRERSIIKIAASSALFELIIYTVYQEMRPFLFAAYAEDFQLPLASFTFFSWLQYNQLVAQMIGKIEEAGDWEEIQQFFHHCMQDPLLYDFLGNCEKGQ